MVSWLILIIKVKDEMGDMKEYNALVSIIVPVYGTEAYLTACIDSICNQTYKNIQIILVDDESPDKSPEICDFYAQKDSRITVIHQKNTGVSGARNAGMKCAIGDYVMFVDSDDELYINAVESLLKNASLYKADIVSATKKVIGKNGKVISVCDDGNISVFTEDEPLLLSLSGDKNTNSACAKLFKTAFVKNICFEEGKNIHEDGFFIFCCYIKRPILVQWNNTVYQYNYREDSNSRQIFSDKYCSILYFCEKKKEIIRALFPQYLNEMINMEIRANLQMLDLLCGTTDKHYDALQKKCIKKVCELRGYHISFNKHHKQLAWIVAHGLYPLYKKLVRLKYYR